MNSMNSKLLFLPLRELQLYLTNLEMENEKLKSELSTFSRFNCILENIRRSSNKGFSAMQCIDRNKSCRCNEHLNGHLRRVAQEADIELRVWQEQYDKLVIRSKRENSITSIDDENSISLSPRSSNTVSSVDDLHVESEPELTLSISSNNTNDMNYCNKFDTFNCSDNKFSSKTVSNETSLNAKNFGVNFNFNDKEKMAINDETVIKYITLSPSNDTDSRCETSTPVVVYDSKSDPKLCCDWPDCGQAFVNQEILTHHRRNHIRKSIYHCEFCSTRLLSKEELENHLKKHRILKTEDIEVDEVEDKSDHSNDIMTLEKAQAVNLVCNKAINDKLNDKLMFQSELFDKFNHQTAIPNNCQSDIVKNNSMRPEEYKKTRYSGVGRYRCPWPDCGYTPHFLRDLRRHMYKHTGDKKHKCDYPGCDFVSVWKTSLLQHQRKKHFANNNPSNNTLQNKT